MKKILLLTTIISIFTIAGLSCDSSSPTEIKYNDTSILSGAKYYAPSDTNEGIYPCKAVLENEKNMFKNVVVNYANRGKFKWDIKGNDAAKYYSWATVLAQDPSGEAQFKTAEQLDSIAKYESDATKKKETQRRAIRAYYSVLTNFPLTRLYDGSKDTVGISALPKSVTAIKKLGGNPFPFYNVPTNNKQPGAWPEDSITVKQRTPVSN